MISDAGRIGCNEEEYWREHKLEGRLWDTDFCRKLRQCINQPERRQCREFSRKLMNSVTGLKHISPGTSEENDPTPTRSIPADIVSPAGV